jgi:iron complex outermembrane receptor protein
MRKKDTLRALSGSSSLLALAIALPASQVQAQENAKPETVDEVVVTGIIGSLQRNLDIKRDSTGVIDAITAEDIGKFPDSNVAASLQRVPGVSIQRNGQRGEPTGITVRGFGGDFNETLVDGRRLSTASGVGANSSGRSVDFSTVGSDFVSRLSVLKTPDISLSASSIGATLNVEYPKPLDHPGMRFSASASGSMQDEANNVDPTAGVLFSNTFANDTMGFLADVIYAKHDTSTNHVFVSGWEGGLLRPCQQTATCTTTQLQAPGTIVSWYQQQFGGEQAQTSDDRIDGRIAFQWQPSENSLLTIDDNYSRQNVETKTYGFGAWFDFNAFRNVQLDQKGTITDFVNLDDVMNLNAGIDRSQLVTNQIGVNFKHDISDQLSFVIDAAHSKSELNPNGQNSTDGADTGYGDVLGCDMGVRILGDSSDTLPQMTGYGPNCDQSRVLDPTLVGSHVLVRIRQENTDTIDQGRFTATWKQDGLKVDAGASYMRDEFTLQNSNTFANNFWQAWAGYGPPSGRTSGLVVPTDVRHGTIGTSGFIPGFKGNDALLPQLLAYSPVGLYSYLEGLGDPYTQQINGFNYPGNGVGTPTLANSLAGCASANPQPLCAYHGSLDVKLDPGSVQDIEEKTWAAFIRANFTTEVASMPFHFSAGVRRESTDVSSSGIGQLPVLLQLSTSDPTLLQTTFSDPQPITTTSSYSYLLPSLDMKLEITEQFHLRLDASRTLTRPGINLMTPVLNVGSLPRIGALNANGGNPKLKPFLSDNFDLAAEWYYSRNSYLAADFFTKNVTNFIVQGSQRQTINDVIDPSTGQAAIYTVTQQVNGPDASVQGLELAWQHLFGDSGFGFNANATFVDTNKPYDRDDITLSGFAVTGLANSANLVGFYDKHGFEVRVAANWRDEYLRQFGQGQNLSAFGTEPTFVNSSLQVDLSGSYQVNEHLNVYLEALNITNDTLSTHGRYDNQLLDVFAYGRRYSAGFRFKL